MTICGLVDFPASFLAGTDAATFLPLVSVRYASALLTSVATGVAATVLALLNIYLPCTSLQYAVVSSLFEGEYQMNWQDFLNLLNSSIKNIPKLKYALGVVGIVAAAMLALVAAGLNWLLALSGGVVVFAGMVLLRIFTNPDEPESRKKRFSSQAVTLTWSCSIIFVFVLCLFVAKLFFVLFPTFAIRSSVPPVKPRPEQAQCIDWRENYCIKCDFPVEWKGGLVEGQMMPYLCGQMRPGHRVRASFEGVPIITPRVADPRDAVWMQIRINFNPEPTVPHMGCAGHSNPTDQQNELNPNGNVCEYCANEVGNGYCVINNWQHIVLHLDNLVPQSGLADFLLEPAVCRYRGNHTSCTFEQGAKFTIQDLTALGDA
jgi:hypothetical protein